MFALVPPRTETELEATRREVIERHRLASNQAGMAKEIGEDQRPQPQSPGLAGERSEERERLEGRRVVTAAGKSRVVEVVVHPAAGEPLDGIGTSPHRHDLVDRPALTAGLEADSHGASPRNNRS